MTTVAPQDPHAQDRIMRRTTKHKPRWSPGHWLIGRPLPTADASHETIGKAVGLAVFASDALSSNAYATQEILIILAVAGTASFSYVFPIAIAIVVLLTIVTISYEQIIHSYPNGGGAYIVAKDNLGEWAALMAAAALLTDYILTVAVSIASGVAQIVSAAPWVFPYRVPLAVAFILLVMVINLRGVRESGLAFALPNYFFIFMMFVTLGIGLFRFLSGSLGAVVDPPELEIVATLQMVTPFLILHAFSSGTAALTGIEAISNGITAFKEPRSKNAGITLIWMGFILASLFLGISFLTKTIGAIPSEQETVISQIARTVYDGRGIFYLMLITATTVILVLAANTAFAGFPRLGALTAQDGFLPRQLTYRGSRLVYSYGIFALAILASILVVVFQASVTRLIPLYAIGVFLSFTLAQIGMARRWWRTGHLKPGEEIRQHDAVLRYEPTWRIKMVMNAFGALCTGVVMLVFSVTKFHDGAWIVLIITPLLMGLFKLVNHHYRELAKHLSLDHYAGPAPHVTRHRVIMPVSGVHQGTLQALRYARMLSNDVTAVHVSIDPAETEKVQKKWTTWGDGVRLYILDSPYRLFLEPLLQYIDEIIIQRQPNEVITIVVPQFVAASPVEGILHMNTAELLRKELLSTPGIVITDVPYQVSETKENV
ncbi:MAG: APC family permease [Chloroflexi bacterium]|nr:APC family permease [Chloroflexota bacterium]